MFSDITLTLLVITLLVAACCIFLLKADKKTLPYLFKGKATPSLQFSQPTGGKLPELIDRPGISLDDEATITIERQSRQPDPIMEMTEDDETHLLKAAEAVVEKVQEVVNHIASNPPNPEEVFSKIKAIVRNYTIFHNTEYFDAINSFISVTVERDCGIAFTKEELLQLWK